MGGGDAGFKSLSRDQLPLSSTRVEGNALVFTTETSIVQGVEEPVDFPALTAKYLKGAHGPYDDTEVDRLIWLYETTCEAAAVDIELVLIQMCVETGDLTSAWSSPAHRNPAGIGVTGEPGKGLSFPTWVDAVLAHVGRLLAYALPKGEGTDYQKRVIEFALDWRGLPDSYRGCAPTVGDLTGKWAMAPTYNESLNNRYRAIMAVAS